MIVGWSIADHMRSELVVDALQMATWRRRPEAGAIVHADRGSQGGFNWSSQHLDRGGAVIAMREEILALSDPIDPRFVEQFVRGTSPNAMSEEMVARLVDESLAIPAKVWRESFSGLLQAERPEALEDIHVPTLLLSGSSDTFVRDDQQVLLDRMPDAELIVYDKVGHGPHLAHPVRVAADLAEFVHGHRVPPARSSFPPLST